MSKNPIEMVKEAIKHYEDSQSRLESQVASLKNNIRTTEQELIDVKSVKQKFESSLKCLLEAEEELKAMEDAKSEGGE